MFWLFLIILLVIGSLILRAKESRESKKRVQEVMQMIDDYNCNPLKTKTLTSNMDSSLMSGAVGGAATMFLLNNLIDFNNFDQETLTNLHQMDLAQLQDFALQNDLMQMDEMNQIMDDFNPYLNPGQDIVVDEYYHGIDHDLGYVTPDTFDNDFNNGMDDFGGGFGDMNNNF